MAWMCIGWSAIFGCYDAMDNSWYLQPWTVFECKLKSISPIWCKAKIMQTTHNNKMCCSFHLQLSIGIENGILETYNADFELQFSHQLKYIVGICKIATTQNAANNKSKLTEFITFPNRRPQSTVLDDVNQRAGYHGIVYLLKSPRDPLLHVFLFESPFLEEVNGFSSLF